MDIGEKYSGLVPAAPWAGRAVFTAAGQDGKKVFIREASGPEAAAAPFLSHPNMPAYLETVSVRERGAERKFLVYEYLEGESLAALMAAGGTFTEGEALRTGSEIARVLEYLHGLSPRIAHGAVSSDSVLRGSGGRMYLCGCAAAGEPESDLRQLAALLRGLSMASKGGKFSARYSKIVEYLELPGAGAGYALKTIEATGALPAFRPVRAAPKAAGRRLPLYAWPAALAVFALAFYGSIKYRFEILPARRARQRVEGPAKLGREYPCAAYPAARPEPRLRENLLFNPGLEGPCGWTMVPAWERGAIKKGDARSGKYYFKVKDPGAHMWQEADVSAFAEPISRGRCKAELSAYLRASGFGRDGEPYLYGYAMRSDDDYTYLQDFRPVSSNEWTRAASEFPLPAGTRKVRIMLQASSFNGTLFSKDAYFDDASVKVKCF